MLPKQLPDILTTATGLWLFLLALGSCSLFASQTGLWLKREQQTIDRLIARKTLALRQDKQQLQQLATTDPLTGAANRRQFETLAQYCINQAKRHHEPISLLLLDIDHFKRINDQHGHDTGDKALRHFSAICRSQLRDSDTFARLGGEEFALLLPRTRHLAACQVAEKLCCQIRQQPLRLANGDYLRITVSIGVSQWQRGEETIEATLKRADNALYQAKANGRNQIQLCLTQQDA